MSVYQRFATVEAAVEAFRSDRPCRRHVEVDGHVIDLVQHAAEVVRAKLRAAKEAERQAVPEARVYTDAEVAANVAAALASEAGVLPELAVPEVECCRACGRPLIGGVP